MTHSAQLRPAPKIGLVINSIGVYDAQAKDHSENVLREHVGRLIASGQIDPKSIVSARIFGPHEALAVADQLAAAGVDLVVIANIAFPNGQVFLTLATHPGLSKTPLAVIAEPEPSDVEWATNAWCGVIMNNHVAAQIGRPIVTIPGPFAGEVFQDGFRSAACAWRERSAFSAATCSAVSATPPADSTPPPATNSPSPRSSARGSKPWI